MYKQCCITGKGSLDKEASKLPDVTATHIFPYAYHDQVGSFLYLLAHQTDLWSVGGRRVAINMHQPRPER